MKTEELQMNAQAQLSVHKHCYDKLCFFFLN